MRTLWQKKQGAFPERRSAPGRPPVPFATSCKEPAGVPRYAGGRVQALSAVAHGEGRQAGARSASRWTTASPPPWQFLRRRAAAARERWLSVPASQISKISFESFYFQRKKGKRRRHRAGGAQGGAQRGDPGGVGLCTHSVAPHPNPCPDSGSKDS